VCAQHQGHREHVQQHVPGPACTTPKERAHPTTAGRDALVLICHRQLPNHDHAAPLDGRVDLAVQERSPQRSPPRSTSVISTKPVRATIEHGPRQSCGTATPQTPPPINPTCLMRPVLAYITSPAGRRPGPCRSRAQGRRTGHPRGAPPGRLPGPRLRGPSGAEGLFSIKRGTVHRAAKGSVSSPDGRAPERGGPRSSASKAALARCAAYGAAFRPGLSPSPGRPVYHHRGPCPG
jgi:hypothetical protein